MSVRINKLARDLNISITTLIDLFEYLQFHDYEANPNCKIPDNIASYIRAFILNETELIDFIVEESKDYLIKKEQNVSSSLKVVGTIDIDKIIPSSNRKAKEKIQQSDIATFVDSSYLKTPPEYDNEHRNFWIDELFYLTTPCRTEAIQVSDFDNSARQPFFSVFIGNNGVGKSTLLSEIVDLFIELHTCTKNPSNISTTYRGPLIGVRYHIDGQECFVIRLGKTCVAKVNGYICALEYLRLPIIVACHFGAFEKFHNQSINGSGHTKYDVPYYRYVGAHVNGNVISASSIAFRLLFTLSEHMSEKQRQNICSVLDFIKYGHSVILQYTVALKSKKSKIAYNNIVQRVNKDKEYIHLTTQKKNNIIKRLYDFYNQKTSSEEEQNIFTINFDINQSFNDTKEELQCIYKLKQCNLINTTKVMFQKNGETISSEDMSSGEFAILATILSISAAAYEPHTLVLLDEPELSQHPNWQMSLIENLDKALTNQICHLLIATHSHMIVSDLPMKRSSVIQLEKDKNGYPSSELLNSSTYGWSAEEVLLKVFKTATDRNRYFGERIADLLEKIGNNNIEPEKVTKELSELKEVSKHLSDVDPMKLVLNTIIEAYEK